MKQIKVKAYHKAEKKLCEVATLTDKGAFLIGVAKGEDQVYVESRTIVYAPERGRFCPLEDIELLLYINRNDKQGKQMCEGDVVEFKTSISQGVDEIYWNEDNCCFSTRNHGSHVMDIDTEFLIIGNIYDTPHLLNHIK